MIFCTLFQLVSKRLSFIAKLVLCTIFTCNIVNSEPAPSFDCSRASTKIEKEICSSEHLSELDMILGKSYKEFISSLDLGDVPYAKSIQRLWLKNRNKQCNGEDLSACLKEEYYFWINSIKKGIISVRIPISNNNSIKNPFKKTTSFHSLMTKSTELLENGEVSEVHELFINEGGTDNKLYSGMLYDFGQSYDEDRITDVIFYLSSKGKKYQAFRKAEAHFGGRCGASSSASLRFVSISNPEDVIKEVNLFDSDQACGTHYKELFKWNVSEKGNLRFYQLENDSFYYQVPFTEIKVIEIDADDSSAQEYYWIDKSSKSYMDTPYEEIITDVINELNKSYRKSDSILCSKENNDFRDYYRLKEILSKYKLGFNQIEFYSNNFLNAEALETATKYKPYLDAALLYLNKAREVDTWEPKILAAASKFPQIQANSSFYYDGGIAAASKPFLAAGFYSDNGCYAKQSSMFIHATLEEWFYLFWARRISDGTLVRTEALLKLVSGMMDIYQSVKPTLPNESENEIASVKDSTKKPTIDPSDNESSDLPVLEKMKLESHLSVLKRNSSDLDRNSIPDFAQFSYPFEYSKRTKKLECKCIEFASFSMTIPTHVFLPTAKLMFGYSGSNPSEIIYFGGDINKYILPSEGYQRIWLKGADRARNKMEADQGGDYVAPNKEYLLKDLGFSEANRTVTFHQELVRRTDEDPSIGMQLDYDEEMNFH